MADSLAEIGDLTSFQASDPHQMLAAAQGLVRSYCGWHIAPSQADVFTVYGPVGRQLFLPTLYLTEVETVTTYASPTAAAVELTVGTDYQWHQHGCIAFTAYCTSWKVVVEFTHGHPSTPAEVRVAVLELATTVSRDSRIVRDQAGPYATTYTSTALSPMQQAALGRYRLPLVG